MNPSDPNSLLVALNERSAAQSKSIDHLLAESRKTSEAVIRLADIPAKVAALDEDLKHTRHNLRNVIHEEVGHLRIEARNNLRELQGEMKEKHTDIDCKIQEHDTRLDILDTAEDARKGQTTLVNRVVPIFALLGAPGAVVLGYFLNQHH